MSTVNYGYMKANYPFAEKCRVELDGKLMHCVVEANANEGWVISIDTPIVPDAADSTSFKNTKLYGKVRIWRES